MSVVYICFPVTKSRRSTFGTDVPAMVQSLTGVIVTSGGIVLTSF